MVVSNDSSLNCLTNVLPVSPLPRGHRKSHFFIASVFISSYLHFMLQHTCLWGRCDLQFLTEAEPKSLQVFSSSSDTSLNPNVLQKTEIICTSHYKTNVKTSALSNQEYSVQLSGYDSSDVGIYIQSGHFRFCL